MVLGSCGVGGNTTVVALPSGGALPSGPVCLGCKRGGQLLTRYSTVTVLLLGNWLTMQHFETHSLSRPSSFLRLCSPLGLASADDSCQTPVTTDACHEMGFECRDFFCIYSVSVSVSKSFPFFFFYESVDS